MGSAMSNRLDDLEILVATLSGSLKPTVYGVIDRVDNIDGVLVPNVLRCWKGEIGSMEATDEAPDVLLVEKLEPLILKHKKYKLLFGGRGGMKTKFAQNVMSTQVSSTGCKVYALRERMTALKESIYSGIETTIRNMNLGGFLPIPSRWEIRHSSRGKFVFGGMQNIIDMKGTSDFKFFLMEESEKTSQHTIDTLGPTLRDVDGAELWYLWNTASSEDPMSKEFIMPYQAELDRDGFYEDEYHYIVKLTYKDNPWFEHDESLRMEIAKDRQKVDRKIMSQARFNGIWYGAFNDDCATSIIQEDWFEACIDAHKKLGFDGLGTTVAAADPSDIGSDPFGFSVRTGVVFSDIREIDGENGNRKMDEACLLAIKAGSDSFGYDADGLGATLRDNVSTAFNGKALQINAYKGSESPHNPEGEFKSQVSNINNNKKTLKVKDVLKNKKAQNITDFADRVFRTYEAVVEGKEYDPDLLVSFDSSTIEPRMLQKLKAEACKVPVKQGPTVQFYTKPEMRRGVIMPDGKRLVIPSPNLFDSVIISFDKGCNITRRRERPAIEQVAPSVNYW